MFSSLRKPPDQQIVENSERRVSGVMARRPMKRPEEFNTKSARCNEALKLLGESDHIARDIDLFKKELKERYSYPQRPEAGKAAEIDLSTLYADATVEQYLGKHPEDAPHFGLLNYRHELTENDFNTLSGGASTIDEKEKNDIKAKSGTFRSESDRKILDKTLVKYLEDKPEVGYRLGDKALAFRIEATLTNLENIDKTYKDLLQGLSKLKKSGDFPLWARAYHAARHGLNKVLWWVHDNPILGLTSVATLIVLLKIGFVLFFLDEVGGRHKKKDSEPTLQLQPARVHRPQAPPYPPQAWPQPYPSQQYGPQPYPPQQYVSQPNPSPQAPVFPAPLLQPTPTPLQTALNMPTT